MIYRDKEKLERLTHTFDLNYRITSLYAMLLESDVPVIVQYGRLDVRQTNMAFYTTSGYSL